MIEPRPGVLVQFFRRKTDGGHSEYLGSATVKSVDVSTRTVTFNQTLPEGLRADDLMYVANA